ncbi:cytochrome b [Tropicimonas aquimaris]|uniref:Cytochrome b n=1 Tax=Tropicimonas aquimaris TaxID=914152 RepID=A0ABW3IV37_9RHOB
MSQIEGSPSGYATVSRWLHWLTAIVVIATIPIGITMTNEGLSREVRNTLYIFHKNVGVIILLLVAARLVARLVTTSPPLPSTVPDWQRRAAGVSHAMLYVLLILMAVSGYIRVIAGGFPIEMLNAIDFPLLVPRSDALAETAQWVHSTARFFLAAFIVLHIAAALQHGLIKRDGVFTRMWPPNRPQ